MDGGKGESASRAQGREVGLEEDRDGRFGRKWTEVDGEGLPLRNPRE